MRDKALRKGVEVVARWDRTVVSVRRLTRPGEKYWVGTAPAADAWAPAEMLPSSRFALVWLDGEGDCQVARAGSATPFPLADGGRCRVSMGPMEFHVTAGQTAPERLRRSRRSDREMRAPLLVSLAAHLMFLLLLLSVPPRATALGLDVFRATPPFVRADHLRVSFAVSGPAAPAAPSARPDGRPGAGPDPVAGRAPMTRPRRAPAAPADDAALRAWAAETAARYYRLVGFDAPDFADEVESARAAAAVGDDVIEALRAVPTGDASGTRDGTALYGGGRAGGPGGGAVGEFIGLTGGLSLDTVARDGSADTDVVTGPGELRAHHAAVVVDVMASPPTCRCRVDKEIIRRVIRAHLAELRYCYERALARVPDLAGKVTSLFVIAPNGRVASAHIESSTLDSPDVDACVADRLLRLTFPATADSIADGGVLEVRYPFVFVPERAPPTAPAWPGP
ncbi:MAG TPA: AgmX/PglI C-terminal domain-containing protein [Myxococcota bacterium]|jgi:hypothetical protein|nr:AgmX/PglI C-terminal domain-containing protein [Myxococcota bacterium]